MDGHTIKRGIDGEPRAGFGMMCTLAWTGLHTAFVLDGIDLSGTCGPAVRHWIRTMVQDTLFPDFGKSVCEEALSVGMSDSSLEPAEPSVMLLMHTMSPVDTGEEPDNLDAFAVRWDADLRACIGHLSTLCRAHKVTCISAPIDMRLIAVLHDGDLLERVLESREADVPVVVPMDDWARGGALSNDSEEYEKPRLEVAADHWRVTCDEVTTGLRMISDRYPLDFIPLALLPSSQTPTTPDRISTTMGPGR